MADKKFDKKNSSNPDLATVQSQLNLIPEEFPEGPYGSGLRTEELGKSSPWRTGQRYSNPYGFENVALHGEQERDYPGDDRSS